MRLTAHGAIALLIFALAGGAGGCNRSSPPMADADSSGAAPPASVAPSAGPFAWPASLVVVGDGFPSSGAACRRIGETAATVDFLDDSASLVGCPTAADAEALGGTVLTVIDGVTLVSVPDSTQQGE